jgi:hypothetical protein
MNCLCEYCEGVRLKIEAINKLSIQLKKPELKLVDKHACVDNDVCKTDLLSLFLLTIFLFGMFIEMSSCLKKSSMDFSISTVTASLLFF